MYVGTNNRKRECLASSFIERERRDIEMLFVNTIRGSREDRFLFKSEFNGIKQGLGERQRQKKKKKKKAGDKAERYVISFKEPIYRKLKEINK